METWLRVLGALLPLLSGTIVSLSTFRRLFKAPAEDFPPGWRWQVQGPVFATALSPLLLAARSDDGNHVRLLIVSSALSMVVLFPVMNSLFSEDRYYDMFRPPGTRRWWFRPAEARWGVAFIVSACLLIALTSSMWVVVHSDP